MANNYLTKLDHFKGVKNTKAAELAELEKALDKLYQGCDSLKDRIAAHKANEALIAEIAEKMSAKQDEIKALDYCIKVAQEMIAKQTANRIKSEIKAGNKNLVNVPTHYKKFKNEIDKITGTDGGYISDSFYTIYYKTPYYSPAGSQELYIVTTKLGGNTITPADAEQIKLYDLIPAAQIETRVKKALQAKKQLDELEKKHKEKTDAIRAKHNACDALYNIVRK